MFRSHGAATLRFDVVGHGRSEGTLMDMTITALQADAEAMLQHALTLDFISDIYLLGHSIGGVIATYIAAEHPDLIKGLLLLAPACNARYAAESGLLFDLEFDPCNLPEHIENPEICLVLSRKYIEESLEMDIFDRPSVYEGPVLAVSGENDKRVPAEFVERYRNTFKNFEYHLIPEIDHMFSPNTDSLVNCTENFFSRLIG